MTFTNLAASTPSANKVVVMGYQPRYGPVNRPPPPAGLIRLRKPCEYCGVIPGDERKCTNCGAPLDFPTSSPVVPQTPMPSGGTPQSR